MIRRALIAVGIAALMTAPALADMGWFVCKDNKIVNGPYSDVVKCNNVSSQMGTGFLCQYRYY